jgi:hypothetical protein
MVTEWGMKTTIDIPDQIFRQAKARASLRGISLKQFVTEALQEKTSGSANSRSALSEPMWMRGFGALSALKSENRRIEKRIADAFETIAEEDQQ